MNQLLLALSILFTFTSIAQQEEWNKTDSQGRKQGPWKAAYEDVKMYRYKGQFKDDVPYGKFVYFHKSGAVQAVVHFSNKGKTTRSKMYHESGYMMAQGKYIDKEKDSLWLYYDDRGFLSYQEWYEGGKLNGQKVYYYAPTGENYKVSRYEYYKNGVLDGEFVEYHENTKVKCKGQYKDGNFYGNVTHYYQNGKIQKLLKYKHAVKHGPQTFYNEKGEQIGIVWYWNGRKAEDKKEEERFKQLWQDQN